MACQVGIELWVLALDPQELFFSQFRDLVEIDYVQRVESVAEECHHPQDAAPCEYMGDSGGEFVAQCHGTGFLVLPH